jgi:hypothetical protein
MRSMNTYNLSLQNQSSKPLLKDQGNITPEILYDIIKFDNGKPDHIAIALYTDIRSWYKPKKTMKEGNVIYSSKLQGKIYRTSRKNLAKKHKVSVETIRLKLIKLENLGLVNRAFTKEKDFYDRDINNVLNVIVWKETPHFYSEIGLEKTTFNLALCHRSDTLTDLPPSPNGIGEHISNTNNIAVEKKGYTTLSFSTFPPYDPPVENQNNTPVEPTQEPQEQINQVEIATTLHEGLSPSQPDTKSMAVQQTKLFELKRKIAKTFGVQTAEELANKTNYIELTDHKLAVKLREGVQLTEYDKERLRNCIKAVYGENVEIVTGKPKVSESITNCNLLKSTEEPKSDHTENILNMVEIGSEVQRQNQASTVRKNRTSKQKEPKNQPENEEPMTLALAIPTEQIAAIIPYTSTVPIWDKVRQALVYKHGSDLVNVRFKRLEITEQDGIITFTGPLSSTYLIANNFDLKLMECSELYGVVFKLIGTCRITGEIEERIIKFWPTTSQNERN